MQTSNYILAYQNQYSKTPNTIYSGNLQLNLLFFWLKTLQAGQRELLTGTTTRITKKTTGRFWEHV